MLKKVTAVMNTAFMFALGVGFLLLIIILLMLFSPLILMFCLIGYFQEREFEKRFLIFLAEIEGENLFWYNNRRKGKDFIEVNILPKLDASVKIVYLDGNDIHSIYDRAMIQRCSAHFSNYSRFPHLLKVRNGQLLDESINNQFFNVVNQKKDKDNLLKTIHQFFEMTES